MIKMSTEPHFHVTDQNFYVEEDGWLHCIEYISLDNTEVTSSEPKEVVSFNEFNLGDVLELTVHDWSSYPKGRIRFQVVFEDSPKVNVNRYIGFAVRGSKDNGNKTYRYFKTARYNNKGKNLQSVLWDKDNNPFQNEFKILFTKTTLTDTKVTILDNNDDVFYEQTFVDEFPDARGEIFGVGVFLTGSTRANYTIKKYTT